MLSEKSLKNKTFILEFIELYKLHPCLWKIKWKEYSNRNMKDRAYGVLIEKMKEIDKDANRDTVVKKINSLRSAYRKEIKKIKNFNEIDFIRAQEIPRNTISNMDNSQVTNIILVLSIIFLM